MNDGPEAQQVGGFPGNTTNAGRKRKRTTRACDQCRNRKHRCDGQQPACLPCISMDQPCTYGAGVRKRGLPTGYVKSLELLLGLAFTVIPNGEKTIGELLDQASFSTDETGRLSMSTTLVQDSSAVRTAWSQSRTQSELERRLRRLEAGLEENEWIDDSSQSYNSTRNANTAQAMVTSFEGVPVCPPNSLPSLPTTQPMVISSTPTSMHAHQISERHRESVRDEGDSDLLRFPSTSRELLDLYFSHTHCWLPILEKHSVFQVLYSAPRLDHNNSGDLAVFWATLAISSSPRLQPLRSTMADGVGQLSSNSNNEDALSRQAYDHTARLVPSDHETMQLGHIQALLLLSLWHLHQDEIQAAWRIIGRAVRSFLTNHAAVPKTSKNLGSNGIKSSGIPTQDRILSACFILDTFVSCCLQNPPHLRTSDFQAPFSLEEGGPDEWEPGPSNQNQGPTGPLRALSTFSNWFQVAQIVNSAVWDHSDSSNSSSRTRHRVGLQVLCDHLPAHCTLPAQHSVEANDQTNPRFKPHLLNLNLAIAVASHLLGVQADSLDEARSPTNKQSPFESANTLFSQLEKAPKNWAEPAIFKCYRKLVSQAIPGLHEPQSRTHTSAHNAHSNTTWGYQSLSLTDSQMMIDVPISSLPGFHEDRPEHMMPGARRLANNDNVPAVQEDVVDDSPSSSQMPAVPTRSDILNQDHYRPNHVEPGIWDDAGSSDYNYTGEMSMPSNFDWSTESPQFLQNLGFATWASGSPH